MQILSPELLWGSGSAELYRSLDGGRTWSTKVSLGEGGWSELFVLDEEHAWVAGTTKGDVVVRSFSPR